MLRAQVDPGTSLALYSYITNPHCICVHNNIYKRIKWKLLRIDLQHYLLRDLVFKAALELTKKESIFTRGVDSEIKLQQLLNFLRRLRCCTFITPRSLSVYECYKQKIHRCTRRPCYRKKIARCRYNSNLFIQNMCEKRPRATLYR